MSSRCFWDADTDSYAEDVFMNVSALLSHNFITRVRFLKSTLIVLPQDSLFCVVAVFGSYYYWGREDGPQEKKDFYMKMSWPQLKKRRTSGLKNGKTSLRFCDLLRTKTCYGFFFFFTSKHCNCLKWYIYCYCIQGYNTLCSLGSIICPSYCLWE